MSPDSVRTSILASVAAMAVTGCASTPPPAPPAPGETVQQLVERWELGFQMHWRILEDGHTYALARLHSGPSSEWPRLVFIDERLACQPTTNIDGADFFWASQPGGLAYLAGRLRAACGLGDGAEPRQMADAPAPVPYGRVDIEDVPVHLGTFAEGLLGSVVITTALILSPVAIAALPVAVAGVESETRTAALRAQAPLGHPRSQAAGFPDAPTVTFALPAVATQVEAYLPGGMDLSSPGDWYVGIEDGNLLWTSHSDVWLRGLADRAATKAK